MFTDIKLILIFDTYKTTKTKQNEKHGVPSGLRVTSGRILCTGKVTL